MSDKVREGKATGRRGRALAFCVARLVIATSATQEALLAQRIARRRLEGSAGERGLVELREDGDTGQQNGSRQARRSVSDQPTAKGSKKVMDARRIPVDASVGDRDEGLERAQVGRDVLPAGVDVRLDHDAGDGPVAGPELGGDRVDNLWLVAVVLVRVAAEKV